MLKHFPHLKNCYPSTKDKKRKRVLYNYGERSTNVIHSRLRVGCSKLNSDLCFNLRVKETPSCSCGSSIENAQHFFLDCTLWANLRTVLQRSVLQLANFNLNTLLYGDEKLSLDSNILIFKSVHKFIKDSHRFDD